MDSPANLSIEPTLPGAAWRYKWLVLILALLFGGLGWFYADSTASWTASATIAVQDPRASIVFDQNLRLDPERYVADQIEIIKSRAVAQQAAATLAEQDPPILLDAEDILDNISVGAAPSTDLISVSFSSPESETAVAGANALAIAYQTTNRDGAEATFSDALAELDGSIVERESELVAINASLTQLRAEETERLDIEARLLAAIDELLDFEEPRLTADQEVLDQANAELAALRERVDLLGVALGSFGDNESITSLETQQDEVRSRLGALQVRRDQLAVDAALAGNGVVFSSPAETAELSSTTLLVALGLIGGTMVGAGLAQSLAGRRRNFHGRREPQATLQTGLIADVPNFQAERLQTALPTTEAPLSAAAESFRFVATGIRLRQQRSAIENPFKTIVVASARMADGKTTVAANTAFAAAGGGSRVALIDADFGNPSLTELLAPSHGSGIGLLDVARGDADLNDAATLVAGANGESVTLFPRGAESDHMLDFFASEASVELLQAIETDFDLVIIDAPPVLRLAYSGSVVRLAQRVLVVVAHRSDVATADELQRYLAIVGVPVLGYVYNLAPLRREMLGGGGSSSNSGETSE